MGGNMVEHTIASAAKFLKIQGLRKSDFVGIMLVHATRGKVTRAEPVSALYEQKRVSHVGLHKVIEDQMCLFTMRFRPESDGLLP
jgi:phage terminase large subunit-like protein